MQQTSLLVLGLTVGACRTEPKETVVIGDQGAASTSGDVTEEEDSGGIVGADTGDSEQEIEEDRVRLEGEMDVEYTYTGSLGEFTDTCSGDAFIIIDSDNVIDGEGTCANEVITFNFTIDGTRDGDDLSGILVGESAAGRAETPFSGPLEDGRTDLAFDHIHAADGEALRLVGTMNLVSSE